MSFYLMIIFLFQISKPHRSRFGHSEMSQQFDENSKLLKGWAANTSDHFVQRIEFVGASHVYYEDLNFIGFIAVLAQMEEQIPRNRWDFAPAGLKRCSYGEFLNTIWDSFVSVNSVKTAPFLAGETSQKGLPSMTSAWVRWKGKFTICIQEIRVASIRDYDLQLFETEESMKYSLDDLIFGFILRTCSK
jgi:hypothetical protein